MRSLLKIGVIISILVLFLLAILVNTRLGDEIVKHDVLLGFLLGLPAFVITLGELVHSSEANELRAQANDQLHRANDALDKANEVTKQLDSERNEHLAKLAEAIRKPLTKAQLNAQTLRKYLRKCVAVTQNAGGWPNPPEIVEVSEDNIVSLFTPKSIHSGVAVLIRVDCANIEINEYAKGACPI
jgi:signal transduction histidine kinase